MATTMQRADQQVIETHGHSSAVATTGVEDVTRPRPRREYHHGRTPAAWFGSMVALIAFVVLSVGAVLGPNWPLIAAGIALLVVAIVGGAALTLAGYGQGLRP